jgi:hypothetical protein
MDLLGKIFKLSIFLEKPSKPAVQKSIAKVSSVPRADFNASRRGAPVTASFLLDLCTPSMGMN